MADRFSAGLSRRRAIMGTGVALTGAAASAATARADDSSTPAWMKQQGASVTEHPYGVPSPYERTVARRPREKLLFPTAGSSLTPLQALDGIITPNGLHFVRDHAGTPAIDPDQHTLLIHGMVARPLMLRMEDLVRFPSVSRLHFLECSGNSALYRAAAVNLDWTVQDTHGLLSCAEWTGVRLADVLAEVGVRPGAKWVLAEGADAAAMTRSIPIEKAMDDAILAYSQNGERLRPEQGYPLRLFLPGYEGNTSVKWLHRLKVGDQPFDTREETARYTNLMPDGKALQFNFVMEVKSVITRPSPGKGPRAPGFQEITGLAWSGRGRVTRVEVSVDNGATWRDAALQEPVLSKCLTRFRLPWNWDGRPMALQSRATDETGAVQPTRAALLAERGPNFIYHYNAITTWRLKDNAEVSIVV